MSKYSFEETRRTWSCNGFVKWKTGNIVKYKSSSIYLKGMIIKVNNIPFKIVE